MVLSFLELQISDFLPTICSSRSIVKGEREERRRVADFLNGFQFQYPMNIKARPERGDYSVIFTPSLSPSLSPEISFPCCLTGRLVASFRVTYTTTSRFLCPCCE